MENISRIVHFVLKLSKVYIKIIPPRFINATCFFLTKLHCTHAYIKNQQKHLQFQYYIFIAVLMSIAFAFLQQTIPL